jgi:membrane-bound lytic murein transglycosylase D
MKYFLYISTFLLFISSAIAQDKTNKNKEEENTFEILPDDPVLLKIDSMMMSGYFESLGFNDNVHKVKNYNPDSVPVFDSIIYVTRFKKLNANSPFSLVYNDIVKAYVNLYAKRRKKTTGRMLGLAPVYFPIFEEHLDKYNLPLELKYLPVVESALNPKAKSRVGATGLWQFMYATGKMFDLDVTSYYDERSDVYKSTDAACRYLKHLHDMYHDWDLVLAAYNSGPGNVNKAIRRSGGKRTYWEIRPFLPRETQGYVPAFIAVNYVMSYAAEHNISPIEPDISCMKVDTVNVKQHLSFEQLSTFLELPVEYIAYLNPSYKQNFIPNTKGANTLCLPADKIGTFLMNEKTIYALKTQQDIKDSIAAAQNNTTDIAENKGGNEIIYTVRSGDFLGKIASKYHCRVSQIKEWNNLYSDRLNVGQKLKLYPKASYAAQNKSKQKIQQEKLHSYDGKYEYYTVKEGDNLWDIANRYDDVTLEQIQELNKDIDHSNLKLGTKIRIRKVG